MTVYCAAPACAHPTSGGSLCPTCIDQLHDTLAGLTWTRQQLGNAATRQVRFTNSGGARSSETPLMFNPAAADALRRLDASIRQWQARLADHLAQPVREPHPGRALTWITQHVDTANDWIDLGHLLGDLENEADRALGLINRPEPRQYLGDCIDASRHDGTTCDCECHDSPDTPCSIDGGCGLLFPAPELPCLGRVEAHPDETEARCDTCGTEYDAERIRGRLLKSLDDRVATASEIAQIATYMGLTIDRQTVRKRINQWASRGRILPAPSLDPKASPRFRFGEVRILLDADEARRQADVKAVGA